MPHTFFKRLQRPVAILCMALGLAVTAQTVITSLERFDHATDHHHTPSPLVGPAHYDDADDHDGRVEFEHRGTAEPDLIPHHHHHYVDTPVALDDWRGEVAPFGSSLAPPAPLIDSSRPPDGAPEGPDRPPKPLDIQA